MSDYSIFPKAIDGYAQLPLFVDNITPVNAEGLNRIRSAIVNIETALGTIPQGDFDTVSLRLDDIDSEISGIESNISTIESNISTIESNIDAIESNIDAIEQAIFDLPNALFLNEAATPTAQTNKGAIFVSDGSGGLVQNNLYYSNESGVVTDLLAGGGGGGDLETTLGLGNETAGNNIILSSGDEIQGQTDIKLRSATDSNIDLISDGSGSVRIYTDNPADGLIFLQMGESQQTGMAHIPAGLFGPNGVLVLGFPDLVFPQLLPPGSTTVDVRIQSPVVSTNAVGAGVGSGNVDIDTGSTGFTLPGTEGGNSGRLKLGTGGVVGGSATPSSGEIIVRTGQSTMGNSGDITVSSGGVLGTGSTGTSGSITITTGDAQATGCSSGNIILEPGVLTSPSTGTRGFVKVRGEKLNLENGPNNADIVVTSGNPNGSITAGAGSLALDTTGGIYVGQGGTVWASALGWPTSTGTDTSGAPKGYEQALVSSGNIVLTPGTNGAILSAVPDGTPVGGNARGDRAVDLQFSRTAATQVAGGNASIIVGGSRNTASAPGSIVVGGGDNTASQVSTFIGGGEFNVASGFSSSIVGGRLNEASASYSAVGGGVQNNATAQSAFIGGGEFNEASSSFSAVGGGRQNSSTASYSMVPGGYHGVADHAGELAHASGSFSTPGDAQYSRMILRMSSSSSATFEMTLNGAAPSSTSRFLIPNDTAYKFRIDLAAREPATGDVAWWEITGCIKKGASAATTALVGSLYVTTDADAGAATWTATATADTTNGSLKIEVTGQAGKTIRWVTTVHSTKVSG